MDELIARFAPGTLHTLPMFHAVLGCLLGQRWTKPFYVEIAVTATGDFIGVMPEGEVVRFGPVSDLERNLRGVVDAVGLTEEEKFRFATVIDRHIVRRGGHLDVFEVLGVARIDPRWN